ncbi:hypothetical protein D187_010329 [Cystobacter fuscus DSM 2262]|uniref:JmjC domain-containing protein n=1 Tax=Cystobacter fuscus (strain ATCC 25194 / DSM 2262 / NBRC 100088 / M29) TaxID=1242864 RepID=S9PBC8_CYSF2|nr:hypothetical protein D187_010329 [Cystobacter fuscus DSM 2262]
MDLGFSGRVGFNCYLSASGGGFYTHYDARTAMSLQIEGEKTWSYAPRPALAFPQRNASYALNGGAVQASKIVDAFVPIEPWETVIPIPENEFLSETLRPGDLLSLPAGTWHAAKAGEHSLALNLYFQHADFLGLVRDVIEPMLRQHESWRSGAPPAPNRPERLPGNVLSYFQSRLAELRDAIDRLSAEGPELEEMWRRLITLDDLASDESALAPAEVPPVDEEQMFRVRRDYPMMVYEKPDGGGEPSAHLLHGSTLLSLSIEALPILRRLAAVTKFRAREVLEWNAGTSSPAWADVADLLGLLYTHRVIERVPDVA